MLSIEIMTLWLSLWRIRERLLRSMSQSADARDPPRVRGTRRNATDEEGPLRGREDRRSGSRSGHDEPCWRWSEHVGPSVGATHCGVEQLGSVLAGRGPAAFDDGSITELRQGTSSSILRRCRMTAGSSEPSPTWRFNFSAPTGTPSRLDDGNERDAVDERALGAP